MLADRHSAYAQNGMTFPEALQQEGKNGADIVAKEGALGAARFVDGLGRHGTFDDFNN
jgi:enoyl-CoA hydratase